jgi:hypothetical protein
MTPEARSSRSGEQGVALVLSILLTLVISAFAASLMLLNQTETYGTMNYRMMTQSRYGAEAGVHKAVNYLLNSYASVQPGTAGDALSNYNMNVSPVTYNGQPVVLSALTGTATNYPIAAVATAFSAAAQGTLTTGTSSVGYAAAATLMSMQQMGSSIVQTWQITSDGTITGSQAATEEVTATLETAIVASNAFAVFALSSRCGAISFSGGATTDSYDSGMYSGSGAVTATNGALLTSGGNVGTNGNLTESNGASIQGDLNTPRVGVGVCSNGGGGIANDALTQSGGAAIAGLVKMPQNYIPTPPAITTPSPAPPTTAMTLSSSPTSTCASLGLSSPRCVKSGSTFTFTPNGAVISLGTVSVSAGASVVFNAGTYNMNSLSLASTSSATFASATTMTLMTSISSSINSNLNVSTTGSLVLNIVTSSSTTPISLNGGVVNASLDPTKLQINYAGGNSDITSSSGPNPSVSLTGGGSTAMLLNAPYAALTTSGNAGLYGAFIVKTLIDSGGAKFHYDRHLTNGFLASVGNPMLTSFTWKRF